MLGGIGFTVSIFVAGLAFDDEVLVDQAKIGILIASLVAAVLGAAILFVSTRKRAGADGPDVGRMAAERSTP